VPQSCVATLVPAPGERLSDASIRRATQALQALGFAMSETKSVGSEAAADLVFDWRAEDALTGARDALLDALQGSAIDVIVQPEASRRKRLLICDMDSTMIGQECIDELADFAGVKAEVSEITERAMRGELAFEGALIERVALLKGLPVAVVEQVLSERITLSPGGPTLVRTMRANGAVTALVSGGFTLFTEPLAGRIGFAINRANVLETIGSTLSGTVQRPILGREAKRQTLIELSSGIMPIALTLAIGDGANDLSMIETAGLGVAYRAKPAVAAAADARLDHADLTALLYAQGYRADQFVQ
jgi:phosphoserine phosphatase